jgi:hypothetical protein
VLLKIAGGVAIVAAAIAATILLNLGLLGYAQPRNDPVGKLSPRAALTPAQTPRLPVVPLPRRRGERPEPDD